MKSDFLRLSDADHKGYVERFKTHKQNDSAFQSSFQRLNKSKEEPIPSFSKTLKLLKPD